jgi:enoyl-CoA hydratase
MERLAALLIPVIAVISGHALGGGLELALAADLRIATAGAKLGTPEVTLGMISGWMGVRRLAETIGVARARQMTLLGLPIPASQALDWGLVHAVAANSDELEQELAAWLSAICSNSPAAIDLIKGILASMHADLRQQHASAAAEAAGTDDCKEGVLAFKEKRKPTYRGR